MTEAVLLSLRNVSIAFGGFLAILMTALQDQNWADFIDTTARMGGGHVRIQRRHQGQLSGQQQSKRRLRLKLEIQ